MLRCGDFALSLSRPLVMGIVNLTPDSFSGDGLAGDAARAIALGQRQIEQGADLLDIGAELALGRFPAQPTKSCSACFRCSQGWSAAVRPIPG